MLCHFVQQRIEAQQNFVATTVIVLIVVQNLVYL